MNEKNFIIIEGPDNIGKSYLINDLLTKLENSMLIQSPCRSDFDEDINSYYMGKSTATPIERQFYISMNTQIQYNKIPDNIKHVIFDRHTVISNLVYYDPTDIKEGMAYRKLVYEMFYKTLDHFWAVPHFIVLNGDKPRSKPDENEFFEEKWGMKSLKYSCIRDNKWFNEMVVNANAKVNFIDVYKQPYEIMVNNILENILC